MRPLLRTLFLLATAASLARSATLPPITKVGDLNLTRTRMAFAGMPAQDQVTVSAAFFRGTAALMGSPTRDTCSLQAIADGGPAIPTLPSDAPPIEAPVVLDAGTPLLLRASTGTYAQLNRTGQGARISYVPTAQALPAPPARLVLDVPGAKGGFPTFRNVEVPTADPPRLTTPGQDEAVTLATTFRWSNPTRDPNATVTIMGMSSDPELVFSCLAQDDGSFTFPAAFAAQLKAKGFETGQLTMIGRAVSRTMRSGDAILGLRTAVYEMRGGQ